MQSHRYLFTIWESRNMFLNSLAVWSALVKGRSCSTRKPEKSSSAFTTFGLSLQSLSLHQNWLTFFGCAVSTYPLCFEVSLCLLISFSYPYATLKLFLHTVHKAKPSLVWDFWVNRWTSQSISFSLTEVPLNCPKSFLQCFDFFHGTRFIWG